MPTTQLPILLKRLAALHVACFAPESSWLSRWKAKRTLLRVFRLHGPLLLQHVAAQDARIEQHASDVAQAHREGFQSGRWEENKYLTALSAWKKTKKGKMPKEPKAL